MSSSRRRACGRVRSALSGLVLAAGLAVAALPPSAADDAGGGRVATTLDPRLRLVLQAKDGAYWFGSQGAGAYRWDGRRLVQFTVEHGLRSDHVTELREDAAGAVYVATGEGVSRFDGATFRPLPVADASRSAWRLTSDDLWFRGPQDTGSVVRYDGRELFRLTLPRTKRGDAFEAMYPRAKHPQIRWSPYDVYTVFRDDQGHVWFGTANLGACRYDGTSFAWLAETEYGTGEYHSGGTRGIVEDREHRMWINRSVHRFDVAAAPPGSPRAEGSVAPLAFRKLPGPATEDAAYADFVSGARDRDGHLWLATLGAGVWRHDGTRWTGYPVLDAGQPVWLYAVHLDRDGVPWVGTNEHGVYRFDGKAFLPFRP